MNDVPATDPDFSSDFCRMAEGVSLIDIYYPGQERKSDAFSDNFRGQRRQSRKFSESKKAAKLNWLLTQACAIAGEIFNMKEVFKRGSWLRSTPCRVHRLLLVRL
jgi:hypothetical protein